MNSLYNLALRQSSSVHTDLSLLEATAAQSTNFVPLAGQLTASLAAFGRTVDDYESMAKRELNVQKREKALQRVKKFREEEREMRSSLSMIKDRSSASASSNPYAGAGMAGNGLGRSAAASYNGAAASSSAASANVAYADSPHSPNGALHARYSSSQVPSASAAAYHQGALPPQDRPDPLSAYRMNASAAAMFGGNVDGHFSARENHALREHSFIQQTETQLDSFIAQGREVWSNLTEQRDILKGTQRRLRDVGVTLGLSRNVIGYIERRSTQDNILFVIGAIFTLVSFYYIYKWFG